MLPSRSLFQPYGRILLRDSRSGNFPGSIVTVAAPLSLVRFLKSTVLLGAGHRTECHAAEPALASARHLDHRQIRSSGRSIREEVATAPAGGQSGRSRCGRVMTWSEV